MKTTMQADWDDITSVTKKIGLDYVVDWPEIDDGEPLSRH
jgi:hypothetical protein